MATKHSLQRLSSPSRGVSPAVHILGLGSFIYSYKWLVEHPNPINQAYGWHFQYLTIIGLTLSTTTFILGILADISLSRALFTAKNVMTLTAAPLEVLISLLYWGLRAIDPALVVPPELELPWPADLSFHLAPTVFLLLDILLLSPPWSIRALPSLGLSSAIAIAYWLWIELCFSHNGFYPYPLFALLHFSHRVLLFASCAVAMAGLTSALKTVYALVNGVDIPAERPVKLQRRK
ncbi:hypothetical protein PV10_02076 [Exophiala mesophila]|uniref:FAR-17a/AIG1-like protein n=1 Tax=Exophiala mesophila TaxID=212818 RepID=A0A0D1ZK35_EXOME|nr:uncharacterized protein PV10_02076 [Exophiala mesophila]KIV94294.1 hypothetical protein PV10_02076 [Exophiala mesophila]